MTLCSALGASVGVVRRKRARLVELAAARRAVHADGAAVNETAHPGGSGRLDEPPRALDVHALEMALRRRLVLGGGEVDHHLVAGERRRQIGILKTQAAHAHAEALEQLDAGRLGRVVDRTRDGDRIAALRGELREPAADKARAARHEQPGQPGRRLTHCHALLALKPAAGAGAR